MAAEPESGAAGKWGQGLRVAGKREKEEEVRQSEGQWGSEGRARVFPCPLGQVQA